jgi:tRNA(Ile)-lysidine synthetase-like protein
VKKKSPHLINLVKPSLEVLARLPAPYHLSVAVSGGRDSVSLLRILVVLREAGKLPECSGISVIHVEHGLRGKESLRDMVFVEKLAKDLGLEFHSIRIRWAKGEKSGQAEARTKRRAFFAKILEARPNTWIALGHHLDDQAETIFQRMLRGSGLRGLEGMKEIDFVSRIVRPFLLLERSQIQSMAFTEGWDHRKDSSNKSLKYERNWLRLRVFPELESRRPGFARRLVALGADAEAVRGGKKTGFEAKALCAFAGGQIYSRLDLLRAAESHGLHEFFSLERKHLRELLRLLQEGNGRFSVADWEFHASISFVLVRKKGSAGAKPNNHSAGAWKSALGIWTCGEKLRPWVKGEGPRWKRRLQKAGIPEFLRGEIPMADFAQGAELLLPNRKGHFSFQPSPLALALFPEWQKKNGA